MPGLITVKQTHNSAAISRGLKKISARMSDKLKRQALREALEPVVTRAKELSPVESGALRHSIRAFKPVRKGEFIVSSLGADGRVRRKWKNEVRVPSRYVRFIEFGTSRIRARAFIRRAIFQTRAESRRRFIAALRRKHRAATATSS